MKNYDYMRDSAYFRTYNKFQILYRKKVRSGLVSIKEFSCGLKYNESLSDELIGTIMDCLKIKYKVNGRDLKFNESLKGKDSLYDEFMNREFEFESPDL